MRTKVVATPIRAPVTVLDILSSHRRRKQLTKLQPDEDDLAVYTKRLQEIGEASCHAARNMMAVADTQNARLRELRESRLEPLESALYGRMKRVKADYKKLIGPLEEHQQQLLHERDALLQKLNEELRHYKALFDDTAEKMNQPSAEVESNFLKQLSRNVKDAEQQAYTSLCETTHQKQWAKKRAG